MFIVWRKRAVTGNKRTPFLTEIKTPSGDRSPWKPLYCEHRGPGRIAWTPLVIHAERRDGKPRQQVLWRFPTIRSCCLADGFIRAAWWHDIERAFDGCVEAGLEPMDLLLARDKPALVATLREVVSKPTPAGTMRFETLKGVKEQEQREWWETYFAKLREETTRRRQAGEFSEQEEFWSNAFGNSGGPKQAEPDCFAVLGLPPDANVDQIKARYRDLAKQHHPDKGGDPKEFARYQAAYEMAAELMRRRNTA